jgi:hypothetical protein
LLAKNWEPSSGNNIPSENLKMTDDNIETRNHATTSTQILGASTMEITKPVAAQMKELRDIIIPTERDHKLKKHLYRLFEVDSEGEMTSVPCRYTAGQETRGVILIEESGGGKTTAIRTILQEAQFLALNPETGEPRYLEIQVPSPATLKSVGLAVLEALGVKHVGVNATVWEVWKTVNWRLGVSGVHRKTINRALVLTGLLAGGNPEDIENRRTFNASEGEALAHRVKNSTPIKKIPEYLNCNRTQAQMMVKNGILNKVGNDPSIQGGLLSNVANEDLDDFLVKFRAAGRQVAEASSNMIDVNAASELARVPVADIVALVLAGKLSKVETGCGSLRFRSVFVDSTEVRLAAAGAVAEHGLTPKETASRLGLKLLAIEHLRNSCDVNGQPFLRGSKLANARGTVRYCYTKKEVKRFREEYITLKELADLHGIGTKQMAKKMDTEGVEPIMARGLLRAKVFRRKGI